MRNHVIAALAWCFLAFGTSAVSADQYDRRFVINNNTLHDIQEIQMRGYDETARRRISLDFYSHVPPGTATVVKPTGIELCVINLIVVIFPDRQIAHKERVNICQKLIWEISEDDLEPMSDRYDDLE